MKVPRNSLSKTVAGVPGQWASGGTALRVREGRKYMTRAERQRVVALAERLEPTKRMMLLMLVFTGARVSEALAITPRDIDLAEGLVVLHTLKRRRAHIREIPLPPAFLAELDAVFAITASRSDPERRIAPIFAMSRTTAWRAVKSVCAAAKVEGLAAAPRGMRHSFGALSTLAGIPLTLTQRWLGHASIKTTAIYTDILGDEERGYAKQHWQWSVEDAA